MPLGEKQFLWDDDEIAEVLTDAAAAVNRAKVPDDLREVAMQYALQLRSQCQIVAGTLAIPGRALQ